MQTICNYITLTITLCYFDWKPLIVLEVLYILRLIDISKLNPIIEEKI